MSNSLPENEELAKELEMISYWHRDSDKQMLAQNYEHKYIILYKYISVIALKTFAQKGYLKVSFPHDSNDPFEMSENGELPTVSKDYSNCGFLPMTRKRDDPSMWGNYADKYAGARLRLAIPFFSGPVKEEWVLGRYDTCYASYFAEATRRHNDVYFYDLSQNNVEKSVEACIYTDNRPAYDDSCSLSICDENSEEEERLSDGYLQERVSYILRTCRNANIPLRTKPLGWKHEEEYRSFVTEDDIVEVLDAERLLFFTEELTPYVTSITLGPHCPLSVPEIKILIARSSNEKLNKHVLVKRARFTRDRYSLDIPFEELDNDGDLISDTNYESLPYGANT